MRTLLLLLILGCQPQDDTASPASTIEAVSATCAPGEESILLPIDGGVIAVTVSGDFGDTQETIPWSSWAQVGADLDVSCAAAHPLVTVYHQ